MYDGAHESYGGFTATLVEGSTDAHLVEVLTASGGQTVVTINEDCVLNDNLAACTLIMKNAGDSVIRSATFTAALGASTASVAAGITPVGGAV